MAAGIHNIIIEQGTDWRLAFIWKDKDGNPYPLNGWSARMQVRQAFNSKAVIFDLSTANGSISLGESSGMVDINLAAQASQSVAINPASLSWQDGRQGVTFEYDLEMIDADSKVKRLLQGAVFFVPEVTK